MSIIDFIRLLLRNKIILLVFPITLAAAVVFLTRNGRREYSSRTLIYTGLASGTDIAEMDNPMFNFSKVNNSFDNLINTIKSRGTHEEIAIRLMAKHLMQKEPNIYLISPETFNRLRQLLTPKQRKELTGRTEEETYERIKAMKNATEKNSITQILDSNVDIYSVNRIASNLSANRKQSSDMIELSYKSGDPAVTQETLEIMFQVMDTRYKSLKADESTDVIAFFKKQTKVCFDELLEAENIYKQYRIKNGILNYYEETKFVAEAKVDAETELDNEKQALEASKDAEKKITTKMSARKQVADVNERLMTKQAQLTRLNNLLANAELNNNAPLKEKYRAQIKIVKAEAEKDINELYSYSNSEEGISRTKLLDNFLNKTLTNEESKSKIKVIQERLNNFSTEYGRLAPIGSEVKKLERNIEIAEQKYLATIRNYEEAILKATSLQLSRNISMVDPPYFPLKAEPSKRKILVLASLIAGFIFPLSVILGLYLLDSGIKTPTRAQKVTDLKVLGLFHNYDPNEQEIDFSLLEKMLLQQIHSGLILEEEERNIVNKSVKKIQLFSIKPTEGKTYVGLRLANKLAGFQGEVLYLHPHISPPVTKHITLNPNLSIAGYIPDMNYLQTKTYEELIKLSSADKTKKYTTIIVELPALLDSQLPVDLIKDVDLALMLLDSQRVWTNSDSHMLNLYQKAHKNTPVILLNRMSPDHLENLLGDIPKKRSKLRILFKRIITLNWNNKETLGLFSF